MVCIFSVNNFNYKNSKIGREDLNGMYKETRQKLPD